MALNLHFFPCLVELRTLDGNPAGQKPIVSFFEELKRRNVFRVGFAYAVVAWLVLQVADIVFNNVEAPPWAFWLNLVILGIGLVFALVFSWVFEMTPEGIKLKREVDRSQSITPQTGHKLNRLITVMPALVVVYFVIDKFLIQDRPPGAGHRQRRGFFSSHCPLISGAA